MPDSKKTVITIAGEERELRFTLRSLRIMEELSGKGLTDPDFLNWARSTAGLGILLYAGLVHEGKENSPEEVESKIDFSDLYPLTNQLMEVFSSQLPDPNDQTASPRSGPKTRRLTGNSSGPQDDTTSDSVKTTSGT